MQRNEEERGCACPAPHLSHPYAIQGLPRRVPRPGLPQRWSWGRLGAGCRRVSNLQMEGRRAVSDSLWQGKLVPRVRAPPCCTNVHTTRCTCEADMAGGGGLPAAPTHSSLRSHAHLLAWRAQRRTRLNGLGLGWGLELAWLWRQGCRCFAACIIIPGRAPTSSAQLVVGFMAEAGQRRGSSIQSSNSRSAGATAHWRSGGTPTAAPQAGCCTERGERREWQQQPLQLPLCCGHGRC